MARTKSQQKTDRFARNKVYTALTAAGISKNVLDKLNWTDLMNIINHPDLSAKAKEKMVRKEIISLNKSTRTLIVNELKVAYADQFNQLRAFTEEYTGKKSKSFTKKQLTQAFQKDMKITATDTLPASGGGTPAQMYKSTWQAFKNNISAYIQQAALGVATIQQVKAAIVKFKRDLESSIRTETFALIEQENDRFYKANSDIVRGRMFSAILDGRTTKFCMSVDGMIVPLSDPMKAPFHVNCRTANIPVFESETDDEARDALDYRSQVRAGKDYEEGTDKASKKKPNASNTGMRLAKNPDGSYKRDKYGNYIREPIPGKGQKIKVMPGDNKLPSSSSYGEFLAVQISSKGGAKFIRDVLGKKKGNEFIKRVKNNPTQDPQTILRKIIKTPAKEL